MRYQEYKPAVELASLVKLYWVFENRSNEPIPETIVADGFPELIIHFNSPFSELDRAGKTNVQPLAVACGQLTKPLVLYSPVQAGMIGIRFQPSGMAPFISTSMQSLTDARVPAEDLFVDIESLIDEIMDSSNDVQRVAACNRFLIQSINYDRANLPVQNALTSIAKSRGCISVEHLATLMGTSRRSLELVFQKEVGTSPKMYCRISRFRHLYDAVSQNGLSVNWVRAALDFGFFDQSHLIRDFSRFAGDSPISFLTDQSSFAKTVN